MTNDYKKLADEGMSPDELARVFLKNYYQGKELSYPINPFQILSDLGIVFLIRPFKSYEGVYIPAIDEKDIPMVGINLNRPITRQRFSAAHELCHHLKDIGQQFICSSNPKSNIEQYAENFASELLMPTGELRKQVALYEKKGYIDADGVLQVADYFGVSFQSCLYKVAYRLHKIKGDTNARALRELARKYKPNKKRREQGMFEDKLYAQMFDAMEMTFKFTPTKYALQKFKHEYIYHDSRLEGIKIEQETVAEIVTDLRLLQQESKYCKEENQNVIEVAGLTLAYDYAFMEYQSQLSIYDTKSLNEKLFSLAPYPEYGGAYRISNTLVLGGKFETVDYHQISEEMFYLGKEVQNICSNMQEFSLSEYIKEVIHIHHRLTVIHAFRDGNGRTSRAFANMMLLKRNISPMFFREKEKDEYKEALKCVDTTGEYNLLYETFFKSILKSFADLSDFII